ncbi:hypothetical protein EK21DRAFT_90288 [Setomelanomma holmii]|uniref:Uncharacterized protein n=1 Tax=Setomelanomma holmii TaxID=210430 RepID=A0A9P4H8M6_9PLEO|nr:hypothetical protein EK21DRAFT_90288 [Setomelanomma holmii]
MHSSTLILSGAAATLALALQSTRALPCTTTTSQKGISVITPRGHDHDMHRFLSADSATDPTSSAATTASIQPTSNAPIHNKAPPGVPPILGTPTTDARQPTDWVDVAFTSSFRLTFTKTLSAGSKATDLVGYGIPPLTDGMCFPNPDGHGPKPTPDTAIAFLENKEFSFLAHNAPQPENYSRIYVDEHTATFNRTYLAFIELDSYSTHNCSRECNEVLACKAFNIYFERAPKLQLGPTCQDSANATSTGYQNRKFEVVIAGSNAYNKAGDGKVQAPVKSMASVAVVSICMVVFTLVAAMIGSGWLSYHLGWP